MGDATGKCVTEDRGPAPFPQDFGARPDTVDVVTYSLRAEPTEVCALARLLVGEEEARARRFRTPERRAAFIVGRARLRELLGAVVGCHPAVVPLVTEPTGRPRLSGPDGNRVRFSVAHSGGIALYAIVPDHDVGIDVERIDEGVEWEELAGRFFAAAECQALAALPRSAQRVAFFDCWTRKEAVIKAMGEGLRRSLASFVVSLEPHRAAMLSCDTALGTTGSWVLLPVPVSAGYRAALAVRGRGAPIAVRWWP